MSSIPDLESPLLSHEKEFNWIGNNVELLSPVSALSEPVTEPGAQPESSNTPNKGNHTQSEANKGRIGVEENMNSPRGCSSIRDIPFNSDSHLLTRIPIKRLFQHAENASS